MRRFSDPREPRLHFQRVVLGTLLRQAEDEVERHAGRGGLARLRLRAAERDAVRLREALAALGEEPPLRVRERRRADSPRRQPVSARIAAYTYGAVATGVDYSLPAVAAADEDTLERLPVAASPPRQPAAVRVLAAAWLACAAALPAALAWRGVQSAVSATTDVTLLAVTVALFALTVAPRRDAAARPAERRSGADRRRRDEGPPGGVERRTGRDRRLGAAPAAS